MTNMQKNNYLDTIVQSSFNHHQYFFWKKSTTSTTLALKYLINSLFNSGRNSGRKVVEVVEMWPIALLGRSNDRRPNRTARKKMMK